MHEPRTYLGEPTAKRLLKRLNAQPRKKSAYRIERLLEAALEMSKRMVAAVESAKVKRLERSRLPGLAKGAFAMEMCREINSILGEYRLKPVLFPQEQDRWAIDRWSIVWDSARKGINTQDALDLQDFLDLAREGLLPRLKRCANPKCRRWFYARFAHQRFDSERCQQETFRSDPGWKQKRCDYMKRLRHEEKLRGKKSKGSKQGGKKQ